MLLHATIAGHGRQYTTTARLAGKQDEFPVRCKTGFFLPPACGENFHLPVLKILRGDIELAITEMRVDKTFAIGTVTRRKIVTLAKRDALLRSTPHRHTIDLRTAAAIRGEQQSLPVRRNIRLGIDRSAESDAANTADIRSYQVNLRTAVTRQHDSQLLAVRRPGRRTIAAAKIGQHHALIGV